MTRGNLFYIVSEINYWKNYSNYRNKYSSFKTFHPEKNEPKAPVGSTDGLAGGDIHKKPIYDCTYTLQHVLPLVCKNSEQITNTTGFLVIC
jgi:hypothetical protein